MHWSASQPEYDLRSRFPDAASRSAFEKTLKDRFLDLDIASSEVREGREVVSLKLKDRRAEEIKKQAIEQSVETIRNRVDQFGITEPEIIPESNDRIVIQLPGIKDRRGPKTSSAERPFWSSSSSTMSIPSRTH